MTKSHIIVFLGGIFVESQHEQIETNSKANVQHAADALQKAILRGLSQHEQIRTGIVNVPFIASFPRGNRTFWFPGTKMTLFGRIPLTGVGFLNVMVARVFDRWRAAFRGLRTVTADYPSGTIITYSAHAPFLLAALALRRLRPSFRICLVLPDFPEFMGQGGIVYRIVADCNRRLFYRIAPKFDHFMVLTAAMAERLQLRPAQFTVIEGIYDLQDDAGDPEWPAEPGPVFIYTGTLAARYGILDLLAAFSQLKTHSARLWICGDGDARSAVEDLARQDPRVTYHGRVTRAAALALQARAHVMVNPRRPEGEFTRYSFPSKTMEYLASGRPVVMHWLPGMPEEYRPWLITPATGDAAGLAAAMAEVATRPAEELRQIGAAGRAFVLERKTPRIQVGCLLDGLFPDHRGRD